MPRSRSAPDADPFGPCAADAAREVALAHLRRAEARAGAPEGLPGVPGAAVTSVAVIGGGPAGVSTAAAVAQAGLEVTLLEPDAHDRQRASDLLERLIARLGVDGAVWRASGDPAALGGAGLVIDTGEAEDRAALLGAVPPESLLAVTELGPGLSALAASVRAPERLLGLLLEPPAHATRLAEIGGHAGTSPGALATAFAFAQRLGRMAVPSGGIGARLTLRLMDEIDAMLIEGAVPWEIDEAMRAFGYDQGPLEAQDQGGLLRVQALRRARNRRKADVIQARMVAEGRLGRPAGVGWYRYPGGGGAVIDPLIEDLVREEAHFAAVPQRDMSEPEIRRRLLLAQVDEAARLLEDGAARRPSDIDLVSVHGLGFPAARGGLLCWADRVGAGRLLAAWREAELGPPAGMLARLAREGGRFGEA